MRYSIVATAWTVFEAHIIASKLETEGIQCMVTDECIGSMTFAIGAAAGLVKVKVAETDLEKAKSILNNTDPASSPGKKEKPREETIDAKCPRCNSDTLYFHYRNPRWIRWINVITIIFISAPVIYPRSFDRCEKCGYMIRIEPRMVIVLRSLFYVFCIFVVVSFFACILRAF